uniref:Exostosin GT47 domain-containing protein n=1 Tax=Kalanchoe fedtschenkoi TaxID=63787 RepID=A0A7N0TX96_KALFE
MAEKSRFPSLLFCIITVAVFLLMVSSLFLLQSGDYSFSQRSGWGHILINNTTTYYFNHELRREDVDTPITRSHGSIRNLDEDCGMLKPVEGGGVASQGNIGCDPSQAYLKVYMYDLPSEFHFGLMGWTESADQKWPNITDHGRLPPYPGGLNLQHSIEYWLTLDLLASNNPSVTRPCTAVRVKDASVADIIFVPFFASLSYNRYSKLGEGETVSVNKALQDRLVKFLKGRNEWKRLGGKDHLIVAHHPNSMLDARSKLGSAMFVLADFGRYPVGIANIEKDVIAPYKHMVRTIADSESAPFDRRPILAFFQGAIYRKDGGAIRQDIYYLLKDEPDVHFTFGSVGANGVSNAGKGMASSKFCLNIAGDTPSSNRLFDAIASQCVPVIISDEIELPFEDVLDYSEFSVFVPASDALKPGYLIKLLRGITKEKWTVMWERLKQVQHHFEYQYPSKTGDAVEMIWRGVLNKISSTKFKLHKDKRRIQPKVLRKYI